MRDKILQLVVKAVADSEKLSEVVDQLYGLTLTKITDKNIKQAVNYCIRHKEDGKDYGEGSEYGKMSDWDVSSVTNMDWLFHYAKSFNCDLSSWDVSNVKRMEQMFSGAESFNQDISKWDVSNVMDMGHMFWGAKSFNCDLSSWDVSTLKYKGGMFNGSKSMQESNKPKFK